MTRMASTPVEEHFRRILDAAPDAIVIVDNRGRIVLASAQTERLFGHSRDALIGQPIEVLVPERFRGRHVDHRDQYAKEPGVRAMGSGRELYGLRKDGSEFPVEISLSPIDTDQGPLVASAIRDITERRNVEQVLRQTLVALEQSTAEQRAANQELEAFSYSVAHDLRAPLRGMLGFAQILADEHAHVLDADGLDCLREIEWNARRMGALIDALLSLSRVTRSALRPETVDLGAMARNTVDQLAAADPQRHVAVAIEPELIAEIDPYLARALVDNLIGNAWKFTSRTPNAAIMVGSCVTPHGPGWFVRDNGAGFDMSYAEKLFAPFQRLHSITEFPGTGIGLATVHRIVQRHGGRIWAEGAVGGGATFTFTLGSRGA